jgi:hypothetical protein
MYATRRVAQLAKPTVSEGPETGIRRVELAIVHLRMSITSTEIITQRTGFSKPQLFSGISIAVREAQETLK